MTAQKLKVRLFSLEARLYLDPTREKKEELVFKSAARDAKDSMSRVEDSSQGDTLKALYICQ